MEKSQVLYLTTVLEQNVLSFNPCTCLSQLPYVSINIYSATKIILKYRILTRLNPTHHSIYQIHDLQSTPPTVFPHSQITHTQQVVAEQLIHAKLEKCHIVQSLSGLVSAAAATIQQQNKGTIGKLQLVYLTHV